MLVVIGYGSALHEYGTVMVVVGVYGWCSSSWYLGSVVGLACRVWLSCSLRIGILVVVVWCSCGWW